MSDKPRVEPENYETEAVRLLDLALVEWGNLIDDGVRRKHGPDIEFGLATQAAYIGAAQAYATLAQVEQARQESAL